MKIIITLLAATMLTMNALAVECDLMFVPNPDLPRDRECCGDGAATKSPGDRSPEKSVRSLRNLRLPRSKIPAEAAPKRLFLE